jgi:hypothetical protein
LVLSSCNTIDDMKTRVRLPGLIVEFEGDEDAVRIAVDAVRGTAPTPPPQVIVDEDAKTPPVQNITHRGLKVNDRKGEA